MTSAATLIQPPGLGKELRVELNEDPVTRNNDVQHIKNWLRKQPHLPDEWETQLITTFLRGCNFSLERTKQKLDMYFTMRTACPEFFANRDLRRPEMRSLLSKLEGSIMPGLSPKGYKIIVCGAIGEILPREIYDTMKILIHEADVRLKEEVESVAGDIYILDANIVKASHLVNLSMTMVKKFVICLQVAYPFKVKEIHVVNANPFVGIIVNFLKPFLKEKVRNRIFIHTELSTLHEKVSKHLLPDKYGGTAGPLSVLNDAWKKKLDMYQDWFFAEESLKANESLRLGSPKNYDEIFGIEGSFRQLSID